MYWGILPLFYPNNLVSRLVGSDFTLYNASDPAQQRHSILAVTAFARAKSCGNGHASLLYWLDSQCRYTQPQVQIHLWGNRLRWRSCVHRLQERRFYGKTRAAAKRRDAQCRDYGRV